MVKRVKRIHVLGVWPWPAIRCQVCSKKRGATRRDWFCFERGSGTWGRTRRNERNRSWLCASALFWLIAAFPRDIIVIHGRFGLELQPGELLTLPSETTQKNRLDGWLTLEFWKWFPSCFRTAQQ